ncbi:DUF3558 family protein [Nocardia sp. NPDC048505]|uniref:DUF3558 family protein n=1 Tax=unclassified Nocardia TaxID=2637762 RepID=UPI0033EDBFD4
MLGSRTSTALLAAALGMASILTACGNDQSSATPSSSTPPASTTATSSASPSEPAPEPPSTTKAPVVLWNPCGIAASDINRQGYRPESKAVITDDSGDLACRWQSSTGKSEVTITATRKTIQDFTQNGRYVDFTPLTVAARPSHQFRAAQDSNRIGCYIGVTVPMGLIIFTIRNLNPDAPEPCAAARQIGDGLTHYLH